MNPIARKQIYAMILRRTLKQRLEFFSNNRHCAPPKCGGSNLLSRRFNMSPIKSFNLSFSLSLFLHILILSCLSIFSQTAKPQPIKTIQVNYIKIQPKKLNATNKANKTTGNIQRKDLDLSRLSLEQQIILSKEDKLPQHKELPKPTFSKIDFVSKGSNKAFFCGNRGPGQTIPHPGIPYLQQSPAGKDTALPLRQIL